MSSSSNHQTIPSNTLLAPEISISGKKISNRLKQNTHQQAHHHQSSGSLHHNNSNALTNHAASSSKITSLPSQRSKVVQQQQQLRRESQHFYQQQLAKSQPSNQLDSNSGASVGNQPHAHLSRGNSSFAANLAPSNAGSQQRTLIQQTRLQSNNEMTSSAPQQKDFHQINSGMRLQQGIFRADPRRHPQPSSLSMPGRTTLKGKRSHSDPDISTSEVSQVQQGSHRRDRSSIQEPEISTRSTRQHQTATTESSNQQQQMGSSDNNTTLPQRRSTITLSINGDHQYASSTLHSRSSSNDGSTYMSSSSSTPSSANSSPKSAGHAFKAKSLVLSKMGKHSSNYLADRRHLSRQRAKQSQSKQDQSDSPHSQQDIPTDGGFSFLNLDDENFFGEWDQPVDSPISELSNMNPRQREQMFQIARHIEDLEEVIEEQEALERQKRIARKQQEMLAEEPEEEPDDSLRKSKVIIVREDE